MTRGGQALLDFKEGTLYPALHGLEAKKLVSSSTREENRSGTPIPPTDRKGRKALVRGREEWRQFSTATSGILQEAS